MDANQRLIERQGAQIAHLRDVAEAHRALVAELTRTNVTLARRLDEAEDALEAAGRTRCPCCGLWYREREAIDGDCPACHETAGVAEHRDADARRAFERGIGALR